MAGSRISLERKPSNKPSNYHFSSAPIIAWALSIVSWYCAVSNAYCTCMYGLYCFVRHDNSSRLEIGNSRLQYSGQPQVRRQHVVFSQISDRESRRNSECLSARMVNSKQEIGWRNFVMSIDSRTTFLEATMLDRDWRIDQPRYYSTVAYVCYCFCRIESGGLRSHTPTADIRPLLTSQAGNITHNGFSADDSKPYCTLAIPAEVNQYRLRFLSVE